MQCNGNARVVKTEDGHLAIFLIALCQWLMNFAVGAEPPCRFEVTSVMGYRVEQWRPRVDLVSLAIKIIPTDAVMPDKFGLARKQDDRPDSCEMATTFLHQLIQCEDTDKTLDDDQLPVDDDDFKRRVLIRAEEVRSLLDIHQAQACEKSKAKQAKNKQLYDAKLRKHPNPYDVGELVLLERTMQRQQHTSTFAPDYDGPYTIHEKLANYTYLIMSTTAICAPGVTETRSDLDLPSVNVWPYTGPEGDVERVEMSAVCGASASLSDIDLKSPFATPTSIDTLNGHNGAKISYPATVSVKQRKTFSFSCSFDEEYLKKRAYRFQ